MTLLEFARGPGMFWSITILVFGILLRLIGVFLFSRSRDLSTPRTGNATAGGLAAIVTRSAPAHELEKQIRFQHITGYLWHVGLFITVLFYAPHITFFKNILGFGWPGLPSAIIMWAAVITLAVLVTLLVRRLMHPVLRLISTADDYLSVLVMIVPLVTGLMAFAHAGPRYETMLALHLLSVEFMFVWIPLSKLMHLFLWLPSRFNIGVFFKRKGVKA